MAVELKYPAAAFKLVESGRFTEARALLEQLVTTQPADPGTLHLLGLACLQTGDALKAREHLSRAMTFAPRNSLILLHYAQVCETFRLDNEIIAAYRAGYELAPNSLQFGRPLAAALARAGRLEEAISVLRTLVHFNPGDKELFRELQGLVKQLELLILREPFRNHYSIFFAAIGHSAGTYITAELSRRLGILDHTVPVVDPYAGLQPEIIIGNLDRFLQIGGVLHAHMFPSDRSLLILHLSGIKKINVHVRDPRQSFFSSILYADWVYDNIRQRTTEQQRYELPMLEFNYPPGYFSLSPAERLDRAIDFYLPSEVEWIKRWLAAMDDKRWNFEIQLTRFEDFKQDYDAFFHSILNFHQIDPSEWQGERFDCKPGDYAYRKGLNDEWRSVVTPAQAARIQACAPAELMVRLGYPPE